MANLTKSGVEKQTNHHRVSYDDLVMNVSLYKDSICNVFKFHGLPPTTIPEVECVSRKSKFDTSSAKYVILTFKAVKETKPFFVEVSFGGQDIHEINVWVKIQNKNRQFVYNYYKKASYDKIAFPHNMFRMDTLRPAIQKWLK